MIQITEENLKEAIQTGLGQDGLYTKLLTDCLIKEIKVLAMSGVSGQIEQLPNMTLEQAIEKVNKPKTLSLALICKAFFITLERVYLK